MLTAAVAVAPAVLYPIYVMKVLCFALFACAYNLLLGYAGLMSLGHAAFFGVGSYVSAFLARRLALTPELCVLAAGVVAALLGGAIGALAIRRQGIYFAMITLALAQLVYFVCLQVPYTGGEDGIQGVPRGRLFGVVSLADDRVLYAAVAVLFLAGFLLIRRVVHSPFGEVLAAIRENEPRAVSLGYRVAGHKLVAFVLSAAVSGVAGGAKAIVFGIAGLTDVHANMSGEVVLMTLLGGLGTLFGPVVGAAAIVTMEDRLASLGDWVTVIQGAIFVAVVLVLRQGIVGLFRWRARPDPS